MADRLTLPPGFVPDEPVRQLAMPQGFVEEAMDKRSGAPAKVRLAVGSAPTEQDRLSTVRRFYPDAQPRGEGNFVFTDPQSRRPTLYNPPGMDFGDWASLAPEVGEMAGGTLGGVLATPPAIAGAIPSGGLSALAVPAGVGLGAAGGRETATMLARALLGTQDTRGLVDRFNDVGVTAGMNASGARIGELAQQGIRRLVQGLTGRASAPGADVALREAGSLGVELPPGAATGSLGTQRMERGLAALPGATDVINRAYTTANDQLGTAAQRVGQRVARGVPLSSEGAGDVLRQGAQGAVQRFEARQGELYDAAFDMIGRDTRVPLPGVQRLAGALTQELAQAPQARAGVLNPVIQRAQALLADAQNGVPFEALRAVRTDLGKLLKDPQAMSGLGTTDTQLRRLYGALTEDIGTAARATSPEADRAMRLADRYTRFNVSDASGRIPNANILQKILDSGTGEKALQFALSGSKDGGSRLAQLRRNIRPEEWDQVAASVWDDLGRAKPGTAEFQGMGDAGEFSAQTFVTNWNKMAPEARQALFGGNRYAGMARDMEVIGRTASRLNAANRTANTSNTATTLTTAGLLYGALGATVSGDLATAGGSALAGVVGPNVAARLLTSPQFVRWLATAPQGPGRLSQHLAQLGVVGAANPEIREEVRQYESALRASPSIGARQ